MVSLNQLLNAFGVNSQTQNSDNSTLKCYYNEDNRVNLYELDYPGCIIGTQLKETIKAQSSSVACIVYQECLHQVGNSFRIVARTLKEKRTLEASQRFLNEPAPYGIGTAFLVGKRFVLTAGHCVCKKDSDKLDENKINKGRLIFGFRMLDQTTCKLQFEASQIYRFKKVIAHRFSMENGRQDWALVKLDREVINIRPLKLDFNDKAAEKLAVYMLGHPNLLPIKLADKASIKRAHPTHFETDLSAFEGNSGSPVFNENTQKVIGILIAGQNDYDEVIDSQGRKRHITHRVTKGEIVRKGYEKCQKIFSLNFVKTCILAYEHKMPEAQYDMGRFFLSDSNENLNKACTWLQKAALQGHKDAKSSFSFWVSKLLLDPKLEVRLKAGKLIAEYTERDASHIADIVEALGLVVESKSLLLLEKIGKTIPAQFPALIIALGDISALNVQTVLKRINEIAPNAITIIVESYVNGVGSISYWSGTSDEVELLSQMLSLVPDQSPRLLEPLLMHFSENKKSYSLHQIARLLEMVIEVLVKTKSSDPNILQRAINSISKCVVGLDEQSKLALPILKKLVCTYPEQMDYALKSLFVLFKDKLKEPIHSDRLLYIVEQLCEDPTNQQIPYIVKSLFAVFEDYDGDSWQVVDQFLFRQIDKIQSVQLLPFARAFVDILKGTSRAILHRATDQIVRIVEKDQTCGPRIIESLLLKVEDPNACAYSAKVLLEIIKIAPVYKSYIIDPFLDAFPGTKEEFDEIANLLQLLASGATTVQTRRICAILQSGIMDANSESAGRVLANMAPQIPNDLTVSSVCSILYALKRHVELAYSADVVLKPIIDVCPNQIEFIIQSLVDTLEENPESIRCGNAATTLGNLVLILDKLHVLPIINILLEASKEPFGLKSIAATDALRACSPANYWSLLSSKNGNAIISTMILHANVLGKRIEIGRMKGTLSIWLVDPKEPIYLVNGSRSYNERPCQPITQEQSKIIAEEIAKNSIVPKEKITGPFILL